MADELATTDVVTTEAPALDAPDQATEQPEQVEQAPAADTAEPASNDVEQTSTTQDDAQIDSDIKEWAEKVGVSVSNENEIKLAQIARDSQRDFTKNRQAEAEQQKSVQEVVNESVDAGVDPQSLDTMQRMEQFMARTQANDVEAKFYAEYPGAKAKEAEITQKIVNDPVLQQMIKAGLSDRAVRTAYSDIVLNESKTNAESLKAEGAKEARQQLANSQRAGTAKANAASASPSGQVTAANADDWYSGLTREQRQDPANQAKYNQAISG